jgi:hypothetical protein
MGKVIDSGTTSLRRVFLVACAGVLPAVASSWWKLLVANFSFFLPVEKAFMIVFIGVPALLVFCAIPWLWVNDDRLSKRTVSGLNFRTRIALSLTAGAFLIVNCLYEGFPLQIVWYPWENRRVIQKEAIVADIATGVFVLLCVGFLSEWLLRRTSGLRRKDFQLKLSTIILLTLTAGMLLGLNTDYLLETAYIFWHIDSWLIKTAVVLMLFGVNIGSLAAVIFLAESTSPRAR